MNRKRNGHRSGRKVLFICKGNVGRSQMAETFYNHLSRTDTPATSAGARNYYYRTAWHSRIKGSDPVVRAMLEEGVDLAGRRIKKLNRSMVDNADVVIALMDRHRAELDIPQYVRKSGKYRLWEIEDVLGNTAYGSAVEMHRRNRDRIKALVRELIREEAET